MLGTFSACIHVCVYVCVYVYIYICMYVRTYVWVYVRICVYIHKYIYECMCLCMYRNIYTYLFIYLYIYIYKVKVKLSRYRPGVAQRVGRGIALLFHGRSTRRGWVVSNTSRPHFTPGKDPVPILREAGWAPGRKISSPPRFDPGQSSP